jgi:hypothetical protein
MRGTRAFTAIAALAATLPSAAQADVTILGDTRYQAVADASRMPTPNTTITVVSGACPDGSSGGCTTPGGAIYVLPGWHPQDFLHELGHQAYYESTILSSLWPRSDAPNPPQERFAEDWRVCATYGAAAPLPLMARLNVGYLANPTRATCRVILAAARVDGYTLHDRRAAS